MNAHLAEIIYGLPQLRTSETLLNSFDELNADLMGHIEGVRDFLLTRGRVTASFTGSDPAFETTRTKLSEWLDAMQTSLFFQKRLRFSRLTHHRGRDWLVPIQIAHCAACNAGTALFASGFNTVDNRRASHSTRLHTQ